MTALEVLLIIGGIIVVFITGIVYYLLIDNLPKKPKK